jgi:hypothetical protein
MTTNTNTNTNTFHSIDKMYSHDQSLSHHSIDFHDLPGSSNVYQRLVHRGKSFLEKKQQTIEQQREMQFQKV